MNIEPTKLARAELRLQREIAHATAALEFLHVNREILHTLDLQPNFWSNYCDFDGLQRPALLRVLKAFPGHWTKSTTSIHDPGINYTLDEPVNGLTIRCWNSEAPACCQIVETVEYEIVPEHVERKVKRTLICPEPQASPAVETTTAI